MLSSYGCADDRDRIFALYNMASDIEPMSNSTPIRDEDTDISSIISNMCMPYKGPPKIYMDVDYSLTTQQTYHAFAIACIAKRKDSSLLNAVLSRQHSHSSSDLSSWVPD
jgi:hypothetical protein